MKHLLHNGALVLLTVMTCLAQQQDNTGSNLYKQGKYAEAISFLNTAIKSKENKTNAEMWNTLGLAYFVTGEYKKAVKAISKAVSLGPNVAYFHSNLAHVYLVSSDNKKAEKEATTAIGLDPKQPHPYYLRGAARLANLELKKAQEDADTAQSLDAGYSPGYVLSSDINMAMLSQKLAKSEDGAAGTETVRNNVAMLSRSAELLSNAVAHSTPGPEKDRIEKELSSLNAFVDHFSREPAAPGQPSVPDPSVTPLQILSKPKATYTNAARTNNVQGTVRLAILLGASGKVEGIIVLKRLGYGLDQQALAAARQIKFTPKTKDGKPMSVVVTFDYGFNIY